MTLITKLRDKSARVGILGLGYVGLPLALEFCRKGFRVLGFDTSRERVAQLKKGRSYVLDVSADELGRAAEAGLFEAAAQFEAIPTCDVLIICVQTPLRKSREPDVSNVVSAAGEVSKRLRKGQLVVLESTTFPGATDEVVRPILEQRGRRVGKDFFLAFSPERVDPGNQTFRIANTPKVVGGCDPASTKLAVELYAQIVEEVVPVSSTKAAELVKLLENSFRAVNIALVNEMARICHKLGLDVWEVVAAAATKPFGFMAFSPGPGIGGHCIPKDPQLLSWKMRALNFEPRLIQLASTINGAMPEYVVERVGQLLNADRKALNGAKVLVLGVAYKPNTSDFRESPALDAIALLRRAGAQVSYHDPYVPRVEVDGAGLASVKLSETALRAADCAAILTNHKDVDYAKVARFAKRVFDARNATKGLQGPRVTRL